MGVIISRCPAEPALAVKRAKKMRDCLNVCKSTWRLYAWVWQFKIQSQIPKGQISRLCACLLAVTLIDDRCATCDPAAPVDELREGRFQQIGNIFKVCSVHVSIEGVAWHGALEAG